MTDRPLVTFLISTHNRRDVLLRTLAELADVGRRCGLRTETVVVDNASVDGTPDAVAADFPDVRLVRGTSNRGACGKNAGLSLAAGKFVVFLDDDSYPTAESLPRMAAHFAADAKLGAAAFHVRLPGGGHECSAYPSVFVGCGTGFRREALLQVGGLPADFFMQAEEYDLSLRLLDAGWGVRRFDDLLVHHLKTPGARVPTRTTRLDVRNNLTVIARRFPARHALPFAVDWMRRYRWIAKTKGRRHELAFWRGLAEGLGKAVASAAVPGRRRPVSAAAFEQFSNADAVRERFITLAYAHGVRTVLLIDVGKNVRAYRKAAEGCGVRVVAVADPRLAKAGRRYHGIPVVDDAAARELAYDVAVVANASPVHAARRLAEWRKADERPVFDLFEDAAADREAATANGAAGVVARSAVAA
jgi:N-acetylglucosaminyl-diphospho-decaprenol L-rhamnosyltransferase